MSGAAHDTVPAGQPAALRAIAPAARNARAWNSRSWRSGDLWIIGALVVAAVAAFWPAWLDI